MESQAAIRTTYFSIATNAGLAALKAAAGIYGNSYALVADAIESGTDILASLFVLFGLKYAQRPPDENHPYGHGKIEPLITFIVVGFLAGSATLIAHESIQNIRTPHALPASWTLWVLAGVILWKETSYRIVMRRSKLTNSSALRADAWHHRSDAITSVTAFAGILIARWLGPGYEAADDWAALFASAFILYNGFRILRPALGEIMDEHLYDDLIATIRTTALTVSGIIGTEKCHVRKSGMHYFVDLHAIVDGNLTVFEGHRLAHELEDTLKREIPGIVEVLVHIEPEEFFFKE